MADVMLYLAVGLGAGVLSGLLGVGGGIVITPVLHYGLGMAWGDAVALSLLAIALQSPFGVWRHAARGAVSWRIAVPLTAGGAVGVAAGHVMLPHAPVALLKLAFSAVLLLAAWRLQAKLRVRDAPHGWPLLALVGAGAGLVSRLLGVGGGIVTVPLLGLMGTAVHVAVGTSLVPVFTNAALATGANLADGLDWGAGLPLAIGAIAGTFSGVRLAHALPEQGLRRVVGAGLLAAAVAIALSVSASY